MTSPGQRDELPWAQIPHWVMLSDVSREAKLLYVLIVMHVDRADPKNRRAWPSQRRLAAMAGFAKHTGIDRRIKELEALGAVVVVRGRNPSQPLRRRNTYYVKLAGDPASEAHRGALSAWAFQCDEDDDAPEYPPAGIPEYPVAGTREDPPAGTEVDLEEVDLGKEDRRSARRAPNSRPPAVGCGRRNCRNGILMIGVNRVPCHICRDAAPVR